MLQRAAIVKKAEKQRTHQRAIAFLVPTKAGHHTIAFPFVLHFEHNALVGFVSTGGRLGNDAVESGALKAAKPVGGDFAIAGCGSDMDRRGGRRNQLLQFAPALLECLAAEVAITNTQQIKKDKRSRSLLRQKLHSRSCGMQPKLQKIEVELVIFDNDDLAIQHTPWRQCRSQRRLKLREIPVKRLFVPALDENLIAIAKYQRAKSIPFRLKDPIIAFRQFSHTLGQHRKDWRIDGKIHYRMLNPFMRTTKKAQPQLCLFHIIWLMPLCGVSWQAFPHSNR